MDAALRRSKYGSGQLSASRSDDLASKRMKIATLTIKFDELASLIFSMCYLGEIAGK